MEKRASTAWIYLASAALSMFGNAVAGIVWPWLVLERTGSPQAASIVAASIAVPSLLFAYFGGNLIDSVGRKPMSIVSDIISGLSVIGLIVVDSTTDLTLGWFIAIGIIGAVGDIPGMSARAALVGDVAVASGKDVPFLSGLNQGLGGISFLLGPAVAGFLMSALPIQNVLWITAGCSLGAPVAADEAEEADFAGWRGWRAALGFPVVRMLAVNTLLAMALVTPYLSVLLPARFQASGQPHLLGVSMSAYAVGMLLAGLVATKLASRERLTWALGMSLYIAGFGLMGFLHLPWLVIAGMAVSGLGGGVLNPLQMVVVTESVPEQIRGRTFSIFMAISQVAGPIGLAVTSVVLGFTTIYAIAAALAALWAVFAVVLIAWGLRLLKV